MKNLSDIQINKITHGECIDLMRDVESKSIDLILCDLPYGTTQCKWDSIIPFDKLWEQYERIIKDRGIIALTACQPFTSALVMSNPKLFKYDIVWDKIKGTGFLNAKKMPMRNHESILIFYKKPGTYNPQKTTGHVNKKTFRSCKLQTDVYGDMNKDYFYESTERYPRSIQVFSTDTQNSSLHPTQKPVSLMEWIIKTYSNEGDLVLDNCIGSGTTAIAAINSGRNFIGIEKDYEYYKIACERINTLKS